MDARSVAHSGQDPRPDTLVKSVRRCEVCGVPATERTLIGLKNDRRRKGPRFCLEHHPDSLAGRITGRL